MHKIEINYYKTSIGELLIGSFKDRLCLMDYRYRRMRSSVDKRIQNAFDADYIETSNDLIEQTKTEVDAYLNRARTQFDVPIQFAGSEFQKRVWEASLTHSLRRDALLR